MPISGRKFFSFPIPEKNGNAEFCPVRMMIVHPYDKRNADIGTLELEKSDRETG